jgi:hypothetical protein
VGEHYHFVSPCVRSIALVAAWLPSVGATTITVLPAASMGQAISERNSWLSQTFGVGTTPNPVQVHISGTTPGKNKDLGTLELLTSFHSLYFFMTGVDGNVGIRTADGTATRVHDGDDSLYFVGITSSTAIGFIQWRSNDDLRLQNFGAPRSPDTTPEPATWLCFATGLAVIMRRYKAPSAPSPAAPWNWRSALLARLLRGEPGPDSRARP